MGRVSTYLNFSGRTQEAFEYYATAFGSKISGPITLMGDMPRPPGAPALTDAEQGLVMHVELPILDGHVLMGTDMVESMGQHVRIGNNITINLEVDTLTEAQRLYAVLSDAGSESTGVQAMPWGHWACTLDRFGIRWMINAPAGA